MPALPHKSNDKVGPQIAGETKKLLDDWKCAENVGAMVFDTTASNTGNFSEVVLPINLSKQVQFLPHLSASMVS